MLFSHLNVKEELQTIETQQEIDESPYEGENCDSILKISPSESDLCRISLKRENLITTATISSPQPVKSLVDIITIASNNKNISGSSSSKFLVHNINTTRTSSGYCIGGATDFSIAAIMARGGNASSREPSERSLSE